MTREDAWHHHMALVMLEPLFLVKRKISARKQWPMLSFNDLVTALAHLLPHRQSPPTTWLTSSRANSPSQGQSSTSFGPRRHKEAYGRK